MAKTFLTAVNDLLKDAGFVQGAAGALTSFTDAQRQTAVDRALNAWNAVIRTVYSSGSFPKEAATSTITLIASTYSYSLAADFEKMAAGDDGVAILTDNTNRNYMYPYPGGWMRLRVDRPNRASYTGLPYYWVINPTDGKLETDNVPTSNEASRVYTYAYEKTLTLSLTTDTFPFSDSVVDALRPAAVEEWRRAGVGSDGQRIFDQLRYETSLALAASYLRQMPMRSRYA